MRFILLASALVALAPAARAQMAPPATTVIVPAPPATSLTVRTEITTSDGPVGGPATPGNCGTPSDPKACPPLPTTPLQTYPANKP